MSFYELKENENMMAEINRMKAGSVSLSLAKQLAKLDSDPSKPESESSLPFRLKRGTKKYRLYKKLLHAEPRDAVKKFHEKKLKNFSIAVDQDSQCTAHTFSVPTQEIADTIDMMKADVTSSGYIMINCADGIFRRISTKTYTKLSKLRAVAIYSETIVCEDGEEDYEVVFSDTRVLDSINALLRALTEERIRCDCIYETQIKYCWYSSYDFRYKILTRDKDGKFRYYSDINAFCKKYGIELI